MHHKINEKSEENREALNMNLQQYKSYYEISNYSIDFRFGQIHTIHIYVEENLREY